ncbi:helix-turn-helix domain-containing protein [Rossellomorea vietnamensis]|uniref:Helix-turn-helix domain-containing protein n=1 Tax=Rossellomorea vietnamensis TaxID=218284 RepID=A0ACD4C5N9_9BACI|nr:helix-turn-helix transcriptional regulator [Rossellomorea vietnamensis]UXH43704.1 helix-turn-helix domain-containing protein [Rossellomorea vietnamensis]WQI95063.1 helix-turn-helix transcriptional regulator [Rossellomorea vietnamensis]
MSHFGENLKRIREERKLSQQELALRARLGTKTIEKYESDLQIPDTQTILKLSTVLDIPASELMEREVKGHHTPTGVDAEMEQLIKELGPKRTKLILRKAKEFSEEDFLRVMQMLYELKYETHES